MRFPGKREREREREKEELGRKIEDRRVEEEQGARAAGPGAAQGLTDRERDRRDRDRPSGEYIDAGQQTSTPESGLRWTSPSSQDMRSHRAGAGVRAIRSWSIRVYRSQRCPIMKDPSQLGLGRNRNRSTSRCNSPVTILSETGKSQSHPGLFEPAARAAYIIQRGQRS